MNLKRVSLLSLIFLLLLATPVLPRSSSMHFLTKGLADTLFCELTGCIMQGDINLGGYSIFNAFWINSTSQSINESISVTGDITANGTFYGNYVEIRTTESAYTNSTLRINGVDFGNPGGGERYGEKLEFFRDGTSFWSFFSDRATSSLFILDGNGNEIHAFTDDGYLGINTSSPSSSLHVNGDITITGKILSDDYTLQSVYDNEDNTKLINMSSNEFITFDMGNDASIIYNLHGSPTSPATVEFNNDNYTVFEITETSVHQAGQPSIYSVGWIPRLDNTYDLGTGPFIGAPNGSRWRDLYLAGTILGQNGSFSMNSTSADIKVGSNNFNITNQGTNVQTAGNFTSKGLISEVLYSPYVNRSYIEFLQSGTIRMVVDPVNTLPKPLRASTLHPQSFTSSKGTNWKQTCTDKTCTLTSYNGLRNVYEDNIWKPLEQAKSLKLVSDVTCNIESDSIHLISCIDYNFTSITIQVSVNACKNTSCNSIPIKVFRNTLQNDTELIVSTEVVSLRQDLNFKDRFDIQTLTIPMKYGDTLHFGKTSSTLTLDVADEEVVEDSSIHEGSPTTAWGGLTLLWLSNITADNRYGLLRFNKSALPGGVTIENAVLSIYINTNRLDSAGEGWNISSHHIYDSYDWHESTVTWNTGPTPSDYNTTKTDDLYFYGGAGNPMFRQHWDVTDSVQAEASDNISFYLLAHDVFGSPASDWLIVDSKESATPSNRPYLNITYSIDTSVSSTLNSPSDASSDSDGDFIFNCSAVSTASNITNITLYTDISGSWNVQETNIVTGTSNSTLFYINNTPRGTYTWNCLAANDDEDLSFAASNFTVTFAAYAPQFLVTDKDLVNMFSVNILGDMWLGRNANITANLTIGETNSYHVGTTPGLTGNFSTGNCWINFLGGIATSTNCTAY